MKTLILILLTITLQAQVNLHIPKQEFKLNGMQYAGIGLLFIGGVADGYNQVVRHHYYIMQEKHPNINDNFWGEEQWKNKWQLDENGELIPYGKEGWIYPKYKEKFWGSSRWFVGVTDAHHLTRLIDQTLTVGGSVMITIGEKKPFNYYMKQIAKGLIVRQAGFWIVHDVIYK